MLDILLNWNRWGNNPLYSGYKREILEKISSQLGMPEVSAIIGLRRSGKTTLLYQIMDLLEQQNIPQRAMLYVNFEDPGFSNHLTPKLLDAIYTTYRIEVYPQGRAYFFFDEIQVVPGWERWVSTRNETENIKIFVSGSSAKLMSRELATLLTGRHISTIVHPLSFKEFLGLSAIEIPKPPVPYWPPPPIQAALNRYLKWGGLPRVALEDDENKKRALLRAYLDDILFKDIAMRHNIRNVNLLRDLAVYLLTQTGCLITYKRLANIYNVSQDIIQTYCGYIEEAFLTSVLPVYSLKAAERNRNPKKLHVHDLGFRHIANMSETKDFSKLIETAVYQKLDREDHDGIFYWKDKGEVDLVVRQGIELTQFIQVFYAGLDNPKTVQREVNALKEAHNQHPNAEKILVTAQWPEQLPELPPYVKLQPLWRFILEILNKF